ncbi:Ras subfamily protein [Acanthamoeba castellanii str. Neff]|uniref:Ras subfamily protein n=1 Tax=Acanthamoeba castellanii (strain ATCC 30010 / Neff) TaxID=1257118 RepID=L8GK82_ACACF|nr:Ras subfamily protein [Acanthamoeba castellanii str. Neff]ELR13495.1 Ras subfamily protein [Acanthamoeba castellanii str. Neff]
MASHSTADAEAAKVTIVGEEMVGKTSLHRVLCGTGPFEEKYRTTVGPPRPHTFTWPGTESPRSVQLVDTAGQLRMRNYTLSLSRSRLTPEHHTHSSGLPGSKGVWLTFDLSRAASFKQLEEEEWLRHINTKTGGGAVVMLIGNKADQQREVGADEAERWADQHGLLYAEVSAKEPATVEAALNTLLRAIPL